MFFAIKTAGLAAKMGLTFCSSEALILRGSTVACVTVPALKAPSTFTAANLTYRQCFCLRPVMSSCVRSGEKARHADIRLV